MHDLLAWLHSSTEPWTRYRTALDLEARRPTDAEVIELYQAMITHPQVVDLLNQAVAWPGYALKRHNDAKHPLYCLSTLADFGVKPDHPLLEQAVAAIADHQDPDGAFQYVVNIPKAFGGSGADLWTWILCGTPTLLYALIAFGLQDDLRVRRAIEHLLGLTHENGWRCSASPMLGRFKGPGRREHPCPIANLIALKALSLLPEYHDHAAVRAGVETLLQHWADRTQRKYYLFGIGTDFKKIKYPLIWYDILHVTEVLSRFASARQDARYREMLALLAGQCDEHGRVTAGSMYTAWKDWSFANKKGPSAWTTFLVQRILSRQEIAAIHNP